MADIVVLIPHYNAFDSLIKSIKSIDDVINIDLVIVDDGSDQPLKKDDFDFFKYGKVKSINLKKNQGIENALNSGLKEIVKNKYTFTARLDCGDTCLKNRFSKQVDFLKENPEIQLIGSSVNIVDENGRFLYELNNPKDHEKIRKKMFLNTMFVHPSVCFRTSIIDEIGCYPVNYPAAEDYALFFKIVSSFKTANLPEVLLNYELNQKSISSTKRKTQVKSRVRVILDNFYFGFYPIYGLIRNLLLLLVSRNVTTVLKKAIYKK